MPTVFFTPPLREPHHYDPSFKVDVYLHEPLWSDRDGDCEYQMLALAAQLDILFKKELLEQPTYSVANGQTSSSFTNKAMLLREHMEVAYTALCTSRGDQCHLDQYLESSRIGRLFPRAAAFVSDPEKITYSLKKTRMDAYFSSLAGFQQVLTLARQIHEDLSTSNNHKYIAHQVAVLYQSLSSMKEGEGHLTELKHDIEKNFKELKERIFALEDEGSVNPQLQQHETQWLLDTTSNIIDVIVSLPREVCEEMERPARVVAQFS